MYIHDETQALLYDAQHGSAGIDVTFYVEEARKTGGPVLELGCGAERVLIPTAREGLDVVGLDAQTQTIDVNFLYEEKDELGRVVSKSYSSFALRWIYRQEMQYLLDLCGFKIDALYGDFQRGPFQYGGEQIWVASKNAGA